MCEEREEREGVGEKPVMLTQGGCEGVSVTQGGCEGVNVVKEEEEEEAPVPPPRRKRKKKLQKNPSLEDLEVYMYVGTH